MKKIIKTVDKDFPAIIFGCEFCGAEFVVFSPEEDMKIEYAENPIVEDKGIYYYSAFSPYVPRFKTTGVKRTTTYITHCPVCGERAYWSTHEKLGIVKETRDKNEESN